MRAILCKEYGPAETLVIEDVTSPVVKGHGVKVRVKAAGLNFPDTLIIEGKYQLKPTMPFSPGGEMSGEVIEIGEKVTRFKPGDRVAGLTGYGAFAEEVVVAPISSRGKLCWCWVPAAVLAWQRWNWVKPWAPM